jgi:hypothetical protein
MAEQTRDRILRVLLVDKPIRDKFGEILWDFKESVGRGLSSDGASVRSADSTIEAIKSLANEPFDVVFCHTSLDVGMVASYARQIYRDDVFLIGFSYDIATSSIGRSFALALGYDEVICLSRGVKSGYERLKEVLVKEGLL